MKLIPLTKGLFAQVDDEDFDLLMRHRWCASGRYCVTFIQKKSVSLHRFIMGPRPEDQVDHIDRNPLNNQRSNLRVCSPSENMFNRGRQRPSNGKTPSSTFKGVYPADYRGSIKFRAQICVGKRQKHLGRFDTEEDAAIAYNRAAIKLHGEFAYLNQVEDDGRNLKGHLPDVRVFKNRFRGVQVRKTGQIVATIKLKGITSYLGTFKTEEEAARRWDAEARLRNYPTHKLNFQ